MVSFNGSSFLPEPMPSDGRGPRFVLGIRVATHTDAEDLFQIQCASAVAAFAHIFPRDRSPFPDEAEMTRWREYLDCEEKAVLVAERDSKLVGMVVLAGEALERLFVHPAHWGHGVGTLLHNEARKRFRKLGYSACLVLEENHRARQFYEHRGWKLDDRRTRSIFPPHPVVVGYTLTLT